MIKPNILSLNLYDAAAILSRYRRRVCFTGDLCRFA
ncbi:Uncharacterised protein [Zhongshania aliphaticivorans]|nr:Uncharacterised protein [Zhongshania aliphaticivorans]